jgi:hypothetical protein
LFVLALITIKADDPKRREETIVNRLDSIGMKEKREG